MHIPIFLETERLATSQLAARIEGSHDRITSSELSVEGPFTVITSKSPAYLSHLKLPRVSLRKAARFIVLITIEKDGFAICLDPKTETLLLRASMTAPISRYCMRALIDRQYRIAPAEETTLETHGVE
jgi:hypothetical protein